MIPDPNFHFASSVVDRHCIDADPDLCRSRLLAADPDPTPSFTHSGKSEKCVLASIHSSADPDLGRSRSLGPDRDLSPSFHMVENQKKVLASIHRSACRPFFSRQRHSVFGELIEVSGKSIV